LVFLISFVGGQKEGKHAMHSSSNGSIMKSRMQMILELNDRILKTTAQKMMKLGCSAASVMTQNHSKKQMHLSH